MIDINFNIKENLWLISIVAGILGVITIFTPAWGSVSENSIVWLWNFYIYDGGGDFIDSNEPLFTLGLLATIIIAIGTWLLLFAGILTKVKDREINLLYLVGGILPIISIIIFLAGAAGEYPGFWTDYYVNIASILPFIAGGLGIFAGVMGIMEGRKV